MSGELIHINGRTIEKYTHHGAEVSVDSELKGRHRELCLCFKCSIFKPGQSDNCEIAQATYQNCMKFNTVTPMFECPKFEPIGCERL